MQPNVPGREKHCRQNVLLRLVNYEKSHLHYCPKTHLSKRMGEEFCKANLENVFPSVKSIYPWPVSPEASKPCIWIPPLSKKRSSGPHFGLLNKHLSKCSTGFFFLKWSIHLRGSLKLSWSSDVKTALFQHLLLSSSATTETSSNSSPKAGTKELQTLWLKDCFILSSGNQWMKRYQLRSSRHKIHPTSDPWDQFLLLSPCPQSTLNQSNGRFEPWLRNVWSTKTKPSLFKVWLYYWK